MYLVRLVYVSTKSSNWQPGDIDNILKSSTKNNSKSDISGALFFNDEYFLQCLEGSRTAVNERFMAIQSDPRHERVTLLKYEETDAREFGKWEMLFIPGKSLSFDNIKRFSTSSELNPYNMSGAAALSLCMEASKHL